MTMQTELPPAKPQLQQSLPASAPPKAEGIFGLWSLRHLIWLMVKRDLLGRYKGSAMGFFWTIINPLGHMLLYIFVFSLILKVRFGTTDSTSNFALYLMAGLLPWGALSEAALRVTGCVSEQPNLVKRVVFPLEILPLSVAISTMLSELVGLALLAVAIPCLGGIVHPTCLFLPVIMLSQFMFIAGLSWFLASFGVYLQDLRHVMSLALSVWMYCSPVVYPASTFPPSLQWMIWVNPMVGIIGDYRRVLLEGKPPDPAMYFTYTTIAVVCWFLGYHFFRKTKRSFADVV